MTAFGDSVFTDLEDSYWAYDYIKKVVDLGLMDGYSDGTFKPNEIVNTVDALIYITRLYNIPLSQVKEWRNKYDAILNRYLLSEEEKDALAIALEEELVSQIFVENSLFAGAQIKPVNKAELSKYIAMAMGMKKGGQTGIILGFNDVEAIPNDVIPYIDFLIDNGVLNEEGDGAGNFNPNQYVTRAILAKMISQAYDYLKGPANVIDNEPDSEIYDNSSKGYDGYIKAIYISEKPIISIEHEDGSIDSYFISDKAVMTLGTDNIDIYDLRLNFYVNLMVKNNEITKLSVEGFKVGN